MKKIETDFDSKFFQISTMICNWSQDVFPKSPHLRQKYKTCPNLYEKYMYELLESSENENSEFVSVSDKDNNLLSFIAMVKYDDDIIYISKMRAVDSDNHIFLLNTVKRMKNDNTRFVGFLGKISTFKPIYEKYGANFLQRNEWIIEFPKNDSEDDWDMFLF